ncbi:hypothetical protein Vretimale_19933, partial [Volvox reticuliferus]
MRHHGGLMRLRQRAPAGPSPDEEEEEEEDRWAEAVGTASTARTTISTYTVHDGALLDFSLLGGALHPDKRHIRAVYGEGITPDDILYGRYAVQMRRLRYSSPPWLQSAPYPPCACLRPP